MLEGFCGSQITIIKLTSKILMPNLSAVIITHNESQNIARCLAALKKVTDDIVVVDAFSDDETVLICEKNGARVIQRKWEGYAKNKNYANDQAKHDWILSIDADEVLSDELILNIQQLQLQPHQVYELDRINNFCGQWIKHSGWYPDWKVRIFNRNEVYWVGAFVHERLKYTANLKTQQLKGKLFHYSYKTLADHKQRIERYSQLAAEEMHSKGKQASFLKLYLSPVSRFLKTLILKRAFLDGKNGWIISRRNALLVYLKYKKLQALNNK